MCYSKEVQLLTSLLIFISCIVYYFYFHKKYKNVWYQRVLNSILFVFICIGLHQFFEFLALETGSVLMYKTGLIISLSAMYFVLRSFEILTNRNIHKNIALYLLGIVSLWIFATPMHFEGVSFYVRHYAVFFWSVAWMFLFIYWHICIFSYWKEKEKKKEKALLLYMLCLIDGSFLLSVLYVLLGNWLFHVNVCLDAPSIWCTFYVLQAFLIPLFLSQLPKLFKQEKKTMQSIKKTVLFLLVSLIIVVALIALLPLFDCLSMKVVFP